LQITDTAGCGGEASTPAQITFVISLVPFDDGHVPWSLYVEFMVDFTASSWTNGTLGGYVTGIFPSVAAGPFALSFANGYDPAPPSEASLSLSGSFDPAVGLVGVLYDPPLWEVGVRPSLLGSEPCAYQARGRRP